HISHLKIFFVLLLYNEALTPSIGFFLETVKKEQMFSHPLSVQFLDRRKNIIRTIAAFFGFFSGSLSGKDQCSLHPRLMSAEDVCVKPVSHYQSFFPGKMV